MPQRHKGEKLFKFIFVPWCLSGDEKSFVIKNKKVIAK